ncbi:MAG TPA: biotin--[acetyl-CoA-carboxylase] ligase [Gallionellaceae bacterium]|nr:biotin--[acetyl-CoA-carboxylase] ligase [Gallionellaceae bacterium]
MNSDQIGAAAPKPLTFALLRLLGDGEFHSGEVLAQRLGVSRASVNNALRDIDQYGLKLYSVRGRGYCLTEAPQWLDAARIREQLGADAGKFHIEILDQAASSNTLLLQRAAQHAPGGSVLAVEWQSGGRGRLGRSWHSGLGNALTFSLLWRFDCGLSGLAGLSLAAGVALVRALQQCGVAGVQLKWPNDVLGRRGKLAGILIEAQGDMLGPSAVVIGVGLNVRLSEAELQQIGQPATSLLQMTDLPPERNVLLAAILRELAAVLEDFSSRGFAALREEWMRYHRYQRQRVQLLLPDGRALAGTASGVTAEGALQLETAGADGRPQVQIFHAGEISLRSASDTAD